VISGVVIEGNVTQLPVGITLNSPFFPEGTVLLKYDHASTKITTSNPANATRKGIDIVSSDWQAIEYGYANPGLVDKMGYKSGDIIYNTRKDLYPEVLFWMCSSSGITNTSIPPVFRAFEISGGGAGESQTISSGAATSIADNSSTVYIDPSAAISKHVLTLPANPADGKEIRLLFGGKITSGIVVDNLSITAASGQSLIQSSSPAKASAGDTFIYQYKAANKKWYRIK